MKEFIDGDNGTEMRSRFVISFSFMENASAISDKGKKRSLIINLGKPKKRRNSYVFIRFAGRRYGAC